MVYNIIKTIIKPVHRFYYKNIFIEGKDNIPAGNVIFVANHQNALMDALAVVLSSGKNPYIVARSEVFEKYKFLAKLLRVIPIFSKSDANDGKQANSAVFDKAAELVAQGESVLLFPEAGHAKERRLQALRKGFVRIGFTALEKLEFKSEVHVVPIGLYYSDYSAFKHNMHVRFGKPIAMSKYKEVYEKNPHKAFNIVKSSTAKRIIPMMINIKNHDFYHTFERFIAIYTERLLPKLDYSERTQRNLFLSQQKVVYLMNHVLERDPDGFEELRLEMDEYFNETNRLKIGYEEIDFFEKKSMSSLSAVLRLLVSFIPMIYGMIHNIIPYLIIKRNVKKHNDPHFNSTLKFGYALSAFPIMWALFALIIGTTLLSGWPLVAYIISMPLTGYFFYKWKLWMHSFRVAIRLRKANRSKSGDVYQMLQQRQDIFTKIDTMIAPYF